MLGQDQFRGPYLAQVLRAVLQVHQCTHKQARRVTTGMVGPHKDKKHLRSQIDGPFLAQRVHLAKQQFLLHVMPPKPSGRRAQPTIQP